MLRNLTVAAASAALAATPALSGESKPIDLGIAQDDVWAYISATDPASNIVLSAWGSSDVDLNPEGFPGGPATRNFWSHAFVGWELPPLDPDFAWGGGMIVLTLASDTWQNMEGDVYVRFLDRGFDESDWNISSNTPIPVPALGVVAGDDSSTIGADTNVIISLPADLDPSIWQPWVLSGQIYLAITADNAPPPPSGGGGPPDLTGTLQIYSGEDAFGRGPSMTLARASRPAGDVNADGVVNSTDLGMLLGSWGSDFFFADANGDGVVNSSDLGMLLGNWTAAP